MNTAVKVDAATYNALLGRVITLEMGVRLDANCRELFNCACKGPLPECMCKKQSRLIKAAIDAGYLPEQENAK